MLRQSITFSNRSPGRPQRLGQVRRLRTLAVDVTRVLLTWMERAGQRRALGELEDHHLVDIGRSRAEARRECSKPFWK